MIKLSLLRRFLKNNKFLVLFIVLILNYSCSNKSVEKKVYLIEDPILSKLQYILTDNNKSLEEVYTEISKMNVCVESKSSYFIDRNDVVVVSCFEDVIYRIVDGKILIYRIDTTCSNYWLDFLENKRSSLDGVDPVMPLVAPSQGVD